MYISLRGITERVGYGLRKISNEPKREEQACSLCLTVPLKFFLLDKKIGQELYLNS